MKVSKAETDVILQGVHSRILSYTYFYDGIKKIGRVFLVENTGKFYIINVKNYFYYLSEYDFYQEAFRKYIRTIESYETAELSICR